MEDLHLGNILDPVQDKLDQRIFDYKTPKPSVVQFIKRLYYRAFSREFHVPPDQVSEFIHLVLTGSLTTFQYSDTSDCDVSVFPEWDAFEGIGIDADTARKRLVAMNIDHLDGTYLPGTPHPMQFFTVAPGITPHVQFQPGLRSGYDLDAQTWLVPPEEARSKTIQIQYPDVFERASEIADKMKLMLDDGDSDRAIELWKQVHKKRQEEQRAGGGDYSEGNIVYKWLVHEGLVERLRQELGLQIATHVKRAGLSPELFQQYINQYGPYGYHETSHSAIDPILEEGIRSDDEFAEMGLGGTQRMGVSYLWLPTHNDGRQWPLRIDLRKLDPSRFINDEDAAEWIYPDFPIDQMRGRGDLGEWIMGQQDFDSPEMVYKGMLGGTVAYEGDIPPAAIERNPDWFADPKNVERYEQATQRHNEWQQQLQDVADSYHALQDKLNRGEFAGQRGNRVWTNDGEIYEKTQSGIWMNTYPTFEDERAMYQQGIVSPHMQKMIDAFGVPPGWTTEGAVDYSDGLGLGPYPTEPATFNMPPSVEKTFVDMMVCPQCDHHLRNIDGQIYCEYCGWQPRTAMADRTGNPQIDALIEEFLQTPMGEWTTDELPIESLRHPELAHGMCQMVSEQFAEFAKQRGFKAYVTDTDIDEMGYTPTGEGGEIGFDEKNEMQYGFYPEHTIVTIVVDDPNYAYGREFYIDFTASQYGYTDHPKVTTKVAKTMTVLYDFEKDRITLGSKESDAHSKLIGDYDTNTNTATLFEAERQWVNPTHFRRLWNYSFPAYPLSTVQFRQGDKTHTLRTQDHPYHDGTSN